MVMTSLTNHTFVFHLNCTRKYVSITVKGVYCKTPRCVLEHPGIGTYIVRL